jgi:aspartyl-tRNA(Asn)/glutamyl-tRNA(Gln) amidotransferase subunit A
MTELPRTIAEAAEWLRSGRLTSVGLTETLLERAHATQDTLAAFITISDEAALGAARAADADFARGMDRGPLQGIPIGIKDIIATQDAPTTANSRVLDPAWGDRQDATVVRKLREAGAVIMGKLGLSEFATGWPDPETGFRIPKNPWNLAHTPGGSSSGTGVAVAAGLILGGLGTDTGGSIRGPSAYCGISGIKQTFGLVSKEGCVPLGYSLDHIGPMARTARDCALMLQVMAGYDPADPCSVDVAVPDMTGQLDGSLEGVRIGVPREDYFSLPELDGEVAAAVEAALDAMAAAGATVVDVAIPHAVEARIAQRVTMMSEAYAYHEPDLRERAHLYGKFTRRNFQVAAFFSAADYVQAQRLRPLVRTECLDLFTRESGPRVDVLVTPTMLGPAPAFEGYDPDAMLTGPSFTSIWNLTGFPALSIPGGFSQSGLPIGMQIVGRPFDEPTVFKVGDGYQRISDGHARVPATAKEVQPA